MRVKVNNREKGSWEAHNILLDSILSGVGTPSAHSTNVLIATKQFKREATSQCLSVEESNLHVACVHHTHFFDIFYSHLVQFGSAACIP